jgi:CheY-like chemotaxis protein
MATGAADTRETILVVDDDRDVQRMLRTAFEAKGYRVETADDGLAAVDFLKAGRKADLAVLDIFMPTMDGWAALAQVHRLPQPPPVVVLSGTSEIDITPRIFREGVQAFIGKPFRVDVLVNTCQELISRAKGQPLVPERRQQGIRRTLTLPVTIFDADGRLLREGRLLNLSVFGAQAELPGPLPPGRRLRIVYAPPGGAALTIEGSVRWWRHPDTSCDATHHGIAFTGVSDEQQQAIKHLASLE